MLYCGTISWACYILNCNTTTKLHKFFTWYWVPNMTWATLKQTGQIMCYSFPWIQCGPKSHSRTQSILPFGCVCRGVGRWDGECWPRWPQGQWHGCASRWQRLRLQWVCPAGGNESCPRSASCPGRTPPAPARLHMFAWRHNADAKTTRVELWEHSNFLWIWQTPDVCSVRFLWHVNRLINYCIAMKNAAIFLLLVLSM